VDSHGGPGLNPSLLARTPTRPVGVTPAAITHAGTDQDANNGAGLATSIGFTTVNIGDIVVLPIEEKYAAASNLKVASIASSRVAWQGTASFQRFFTDGIHGVDIWYGRVTSIGADTATVTYNSTTGQQGGSITSIQLHASTGASAVWTVDTTGFLDPNTNATAFTLPTLTAARTLEAIVGYLAIGSSASSSATSGYTYHNDLRGNWDAYNVSVGAGSVTPAAWTSGTSQLWFSAAVLFQAT
jgi:hypothetical protein